MKKLLITFCLILLPSFACAQDLSILQKIRTSPELKQQLQDWVQAVVKEWETGSEIKALPSPPLFRQSLAIFVTAKKEGKVRGCMGTLSPRQKNMAEEIRANLKLAFTQDPWHRPIQKDEIQGMEIYISALGTPRLLSAPYQINPARDAILIRSGSKEAVALPGEAKTLRYLVAFLRSKAGIRKTESYQLYRMDSETVDLRLE
jgi:AMMECR1 domain-containing protein